MCVCVCVCVCMCVYVCVCEYKMCVYKFQYAVLYSGEECLGSSMITYAGPSYFALGRNCIDYTRWHNLIASNKI